MPKYLLPVTWAVCGMVEVEAPSVDYAIQNFDPDDHSLPEDAEYVDGSFELTSDDAEIVKAMAQKVSSTDTTKNHLSQKRDKNGKFKKKDWIAEFEYPHSKFITSEAKSYYQFRKVKVIKFTKDSIIGIQLNGKTGFKHFKKAKMLQEPVVYRTYL